MIDLNILAKLALLSGQMLGSLLLIFYGPPFVRELIQALPRLRRALAAWPRPSRSSAHALALFINPRSARGARYRTLAKGPFAILLSLSAQRALALSAGPRDNPLALAALLHLPGALLDLIFLLSPATSLRFVPIAPPLQLALLLTCVAAALVALACDSLLELPELLATRMERPDQLALWEQAQLLDSLSMGQGRSLPSNRRL